jgi:hypothetical protein
MIRKQPVSCLAVALITGFGLLVWSGTVEAQTKADPFHFGLGALASWTRDAGNPAAGDTLQNGLYLQKNTATSTFAAAGASITPLPSNLTGLTLQELSFQISGFPGTDGEPFAGGPFGPSHGYCGAGAPRFNVSSSAATTCFLGCASADHANSTHLASGWWLIKFVPPFTAYAGCGDGITGNITSIEIIMDEGTDVGPGNVVLDNITIRRSGQSFVMGNP